MRENLGFREWTTFSIHLIGGGGQTEGRAEMLIISVKCME